jgi:hypothetical protein
LRRGHERTWFSNIIYSAPPEARSTLTGKDMNMEVEIIAPTGNAD